jgi:hypothetical protein
MFLFVDFAAVLGYNIFCSIFGITPRYNFYGFYSFVILGRSEESEGIKPIETFRFAKQNSSARAE